HEVTVPSRNIRAEYRIAPKARIAATITTGDAGLKRAIAGERETIQRLAQVAELALDGKAAAGPGGHAVLGDGSAVFVPLTGAIDVQQECRRLAAEVQRLEQQLAALAAKLTSQNFVARAPAEVVARERDKEQ